MIRGSEVVIPSEARDLQWVNYRFLASLGMTIALLVSSLVSPARAQTPTSVRSDSVSALDSRVVQVVSGGTWTEGDRSGQYRIVVRSDGTDEVHYTTVVQWMMRRGISQEVELVRAVDLSTVARRWFSMLDPELRYSRGRWILVVDAATAPRKPATHRAQFVLGAPGQISVR